MLDQRQNKEERRRERDRRRRTVRSLMLGSFKVRRRGPRRQLDASLVSTDWHHPQWLAVALLIMVLSVTDAALTLRLLERGALEANPFMAMLLNASDRAFAVIKVGLTAAGVTLLTLVVRVRAFGRLRVGILMYALLAAYAVLVSYELWLLRTSGADG